jgi:hypothetical protein
MKRLDEIFDIWYGVNLELMRCEEEKKGIPFVSRTSTNNGIVAYVKKIDCVKPNPRDTISVACSGSVLSTFYQPLEYYSGRDVYVLRPKSELSKFEMMFYSTVIEKNKYRYNYGRAANKTLKEIHVPSLEEIPEWAKIKNIEATFDKTAIKEQSLKLNTSLWKWFRYNDVFDIKKGKRLTKADMIEGNINYIGATDSNNGITAQIGNDERIHSSNKITVSYNGSIAESFYQTQPFWATDDVNVLYPRFSLNPYIAMFLNTLVYMEKYRFNYGRKWDKEMMIASKIKLPVTNKGNPDWQFMEDYIKSLPYSSNL